MEIMIYQSFSKDVAKIKDKALIKRIKNKILHIQQKSRKHLLDFGDIERLTATGSCYKIRIGTWRIGCIMKGKTLHLHRFLHRKDIYKKFP